MDVNGGDRAVVRDLAKRVAEIADLPVQAERRELWTRHDALEKVRPLIYIEPEGSWGELLPAKVFRCNDNELRGIEWQLRARIYRHEHLKDDVVIEKQFDVGKAISNTGWGLEPKRVNCTEERGAWAFDPVVKEPADLKKLRFPRVTHDEKETARRLALVEDLLGDILKVRLKGVSHVSFHLMSIYTALRGLVEVMMDMYENPGMLHEAMGFLADGSRNLVRQYEDMNLLSLNNDGTYHSSGGFGYTRELPAPGFDPARVRPRDMWASAEAQELAQVSPEMHDEFSLAYEKELLAPFALNGYGCCEDLTRKLDYVFRIPNIRRISISPFADVEACAAKLADRYIYSWKPHPSHLVGEFNAGHVREYFRHAIEATRGCVLEIILKDTHTCENHPERFTRWSEICREELDAAYA